MGRKRIELYESEPCDPKFAILCALYEYTGLSDWIINIDEDAIEGYVTKFHVVAYTWVSFSVQGNNPALETYKVVVFDIDDYSEDARYFVTEILAVLKAKAKIGNVSGHFAAEKHELLKDRLIGGVPH